MGTRIFFRLVFIQILLTSIVFPQYSQLDFPLQIGNRWQFVEGGSSLAYESIAIMDTMLSNGKTYTKIEGILFAGYYRKEQTKVFAYDNVTQTEILLYDFSKAVGDTVLIRMQGLDTIITTVYEDGIAPIFGEQRQYMAFLTSYSSSFISWIDHVFDGLGFTSYNGEVFFYGLTGAIINGVQYGVIVGIEESESIQPDEFQLFQNYPNPFNPTTKIKYQLPKIDNRQSIMVELTVYDILGNEIALLVNEPKAPGSYEIEFNAGGLPSGTYFYQLRVYTPESDGRHIQSKKMILLK